MSDAYDALRREAAALLKKNEPALTDAMKALATDVAGRTDRVALEVFPDHFDVEVAIRQEGEGPDHRALFEGAGSHPLAPLARLLETLPSSKTPAEEAAADAFIGETEQLVLRALAKAWKAVAGKKGPKASARMEDDEEALDFATGKKVDAASIEAAFADPKLVAAKAEPIAYPELSDPEKAALPSFFAEDFSTWSEDRIYQELDAFFEHSEVAFAAVRAPLVARLAAFLESRPKPTGVFTDLRVETFGPAPRIHVWDVSAKQNERNGFPSGVEVDLGAENPLRPWAWVRRTTADRLFDAGRLGRDIARELEAGNYEWAWKKTIKSCWDEARANAGAAGPPAFVRSTYDNQWIDEEDAETIRPLEEVKKLARAKPSK